MVFWEEKVLVNIEAEEHYRMPINEYKKNL